MGELGSDFSLGGERGIKREEEKERQALICAHGSVCRYWQHFFTLSFVPWISLCCVSGVFGWLILRGKGFPTLGKVQEFVLEQSEERRREDSSSFSLHLCLRRRFFCGRMGAGALTICVSTNYRDFPFNLWLRAEECITGPCCSVSACTVFCDGVECSGGFFKMSSRE